jgi:hypothetical protein
MSKTTPIPRTEAELERARINSKVFSAVADNLIRCTGAFVDLENDSGGSGTFVDIDGRLFVATAEHLVPANPRGRLGFVTTTERNVRESVFPILGFATAGKWPDVAYLELPAEVAATLGKTPITLDRVSPRGIGSHDVMACLVGYPGELIRKKGYRLADGNQRIDCDFSMVFYPGLPLRQRYWPKSLSPRTSKNNDLFLPYDLGTELYEPPGRGFPDRLAKPQGTSGGGWWQGTDSDGKIWHAERVQLFGIQSRWSERGKYIRGCQIHHWLRLLYEHEPDLRETLRVAFPQLFDDRLSRKAR